ncbi:SH3 domain-containing protein [Marinovum sp. 2_MG-2023]|uniref:SH3 domain-containing protein n=1 Tax=Roseobacteraceae TaxID=2854170 RepID=UPI001FD43235|nr:MULTISPECIES: SH3 domain-containing protein [Roseobacteraceae]MCJ7872274.1 SH3 domain-containing protein [Phaeobacter sp. J2-8]MDO6729456.1 SH3 domain-containing protein [Marinovum sp. 2_MG-2023]MDO6781308.1 SH3 domain-containing protein [Marinovum sp. 1_MG-2023]
MKNLLLAALLVAGTSVAATTASATSYWVEHGITLNARSGPGTYYDVIGKVHSCTRIHVVGYHKGWAKVSWKGHYYWVSAKYLQKHECHHNTYKPKKKKYYGGGY